MMKGKSGCSNGGVTPNKAQRRPDTSKPSPAKKVVATKAKKMNYRPQGR